MLRLAFVAPRGRMLGLWTVLLAVGCGGSVSVGLAMDGAILTLLLLGGSMLAMRLREVAAYW